MESPARAIILAVWEILPTASFTPTMFGTFLQRYATVSGRMLQPVRLGTL